MVGKFPKTSYTSLNDIQRFTLSGQASHFFRFLPIGLDPCLNVRNGFRLHRRLEQMAEAALELESPLPAEAWAPRYAPLLR